MIKLALLFKKSIHLMLVAAIGLAAFSFTSVYASGLNDPDNPPADITHLSDERLKRVWVRLQRAYERQGRKLDRADQVVERIQNLIDRKNNNGKDTTVLQAALDAFENALKEAHPIYQSAKGIVNSHQGFDANGKLTDHEKALETVRELGEKLKEVRQIVGEPGRALREAIKAFRETNLPADTSR